MELRIDVVVWNRETLLRVFGANAVKIADCRFW